MIKKKQEATVCLAAAKEINIDGAVAALLSDLDAFFSKKEEQKRASKAPICGKGEAWHTF